MNNEITIDINKVRESPNHSIVDPETIRQIALWSIKNNSNELNNKIKPGFKISGLYPYAIDFLNIIPDRVKKHSI
jgi:hypothetical protein